MLTDGDHRAVRVGVFHDVGERFGGDEVGGGLDGGREAQVVRGLESHRQGKTVGQRADRRGEALLGEDGGQQAVGEVAQLDQGLLHGAGGRGDRGDQVGGAVAVQVGLQEP